MIKNADFNQALNLVKNLEAEDPVSAKLYTALIHFHNTEFLDSLKLSRETVEESQNIGDLEIEFAATSLQAASLYFLGDVHKSTQASNSADLILNMIENEDHSSIGDLAKWNGILDFTHMNNNSSRSEYFQAIEHGKAALTYFENSQEIDLKVKTLEIMGDLHREIRSFNLSLSYYHESLYEMKFLLDKVVNTKGKVIEKIGLIHLEKGHYDLAKHYLMVSLVETELLNDDVKISQLQQQLGKIYFSDGDFDLGFEYFQKSLSNVNFKNQPRSVGFSSLQIGTAEQRKGDLDGALDSFKEALEIFKSLDDALMIGSTLTSIGDTYRLKGEFEIALNYYNENLELLQDTHNSKARAEAQIKIGMINHNLHQLNDALDNFQQGLSIFIKIGDHENAADALLNLVRIKLEMNKQSHARYFLKMLEEISDKTRSKQVNFRKEIATALIFKNGKRLVDKIEAQKIFKEITLYPVIDHELSIFAMLNLCDLLILELYVLQEEEVLNEIDNLLDILYEISQAQQSFNLLAEVLILQSRFALIEGKPEQAKSKLDQAEITVSERNLKLLGSKVSEQVDHFRNKLNEWDLLVRQSTSMREKLEIAEIDSFIQKIFEDQF